MSKTKSPPRDLYAEVTDSIVRSLEQAGSWSRPWVLAGDASSPRNIKSGKAYRGVNTVLLWGSALEHGYTSGVWGTFNQWHVERPATDAGEIADGTSHRNRDGEQVVTTRSVRKGEKHTLVVLWKPYARKANADERADGKADADGYVKGLLLRHYTVFAGEQVEGYEPAEKPEVPEVERDAQAEAFFAAIGADVRHGGDRAYYTKASDFIAVPEVDQFTDAEHYYSTLAHEHGHWTGHKSRLDRDLANRFGSAAYAAEELVAEMTAAFVAAHLGFHAQVRDDHIAYVKSWISLLKDDNRAIFTAASKAQAAADFLFTAAGVTEPASTQEVAA